MAIIEASITINATVDQVWKVVSDLDSELKFWKGTKSIRNITKNEDVTTREIIIAFKDSKCMQTVTLQPKQRIHTEFTSGIIIGTKIIQITDQGDKTNLKVVWDIKLSGMMGMFMGMIKKHIKNGTEQAIEAIKHEIEKAL